VEKKNRSGFQLFDAQVGQVLAAHYGIAAIYIIALLWICSQTPDLKRFSWVAIFPALDLLFNGLWHRLWARATSEGEILTSNRLCTVLSIPFLLCMGIAKVICYIAVPFRCLLRTAKKVILSANAPRGKVVNGPVLFLETNCAGRNRNDDHENSGKNPNIR